MRSSLYPALLITNLLFPTCHPWTFSTTNINLLYPPPLNSGYAAENDVAIGPNVVFPCASIPVDPSQARVQFPISEGSFTYALSNTSVGSLNNYEYIVDSYIGQISLGNGSYSSSDRIQAGYTDIDTEVWKDFQSGQQCSNTFDAVTLVSKALGRQVEDAEVVGMNATFGLRIVLFGPNKEYPDLDDFNQEEMYQCGYVTFTNEPFSATMDGGYCNSGSNAISSSSSSSLITYATPTAILPVVFTTLSKSRVHSPTTTSSIYPTQATSSAASTATSLAGSNSQHVGHPSTVAVGAGVGVSMGASILVLGIGCFFLRRRRTRKARGPTIGPHVLVSPELIGEEMGVVKKGKNSNKDKLAESSGSSVHSEPLPVYTEAAKSVDPGLREMGESK